MQYPSLSEALPPLQAHTGNCTSIEFDRQDSLFATGSADTLIALYDVHEFICVGTLGHLESPVRRISFSPDGALLVASSQDKELAIVSLKGWLLQAQGVGEGKWTLA